MIFDYMVTWLMLAVIMVLLFNNCKLRNLVQFHKMETRKAKRMERYMTLRLWHKIKVLQTCKYN